MPLRSYVQPLIIMSAIPFGLIGAVWGHVFLGLPGGVRGELRWSCRFQFTRGVQRGKVVGLGLPRGSGAVESAIRRVINLRIKGASIYWLPESVDAILLLRSFYKSGRWNCLQRMAMTPVGVSA